MRTPRFVLQQRAAQMGASLTTTEALLWEQLRADQLGCRFHRQFIIGQYIGDFVAPSRRLVVEVDGGYHALEIIQRGKRLSRYEIVPRRPMTPSDFQGRLDEIITKKVEPKKHE